MVRFVEGDNVLQGDIVRLHISDNTDPSRPSGEVKVVLSAAPRVTWLKGFGRDHRLRLVTRDAKKSDSDYFTLVMLRGCGLYKAGFAGIVGRLSSVKVQNGWDPAKVYEFTWIKD